MSLPTKAKVVIVGGGIHGLSTAWKLSETYKNPGDIVVLEKKMLDEIEEEGADNIIERVKRYEDFIKKITQLGFKKATGWNPGFSNVAHTHELVSKPDGRGMTVGKITGGNYDPTDETVSFKDESKNSTNKDRMDNVKLDNFIEYVSNPRLPFNQEEKEVNENYTNRIINNIINNIITENVRK